MSIPKDTFYKIAGGLAFTVASIWIGAYLTHVLDDWGGVAAVLTTIMCSLGGLAFSIGHLVIWLDKQ